MPELSHWHIVGESSGRAGVNAVTVVSLFAATLSMVSFVPQAWAVVRSRNTDGISLKMYVITVAGFIAWLAYGVLLGQWAIIVQNVICLCLRWSRPVGQFSGRVKLSPGCRQAASFSNTRTS